MMNYGYGFARKTTGHPINDPIINEKALALQQALDKSMYIYVV